MRYLLILVLSQMFNTKSSAQELFVFSDLALFMQKNLEKMDCDSLLASRDYELLSPALQRSESLTILVVVRLSPGQPFVLQTGQNPPSSLALKTHRLFPSTDSPLELVEVPNGFRGRIGESQRCAVFVIEAAVPAGAAPGRLKLEPALWSPVFPAQSSWIRYPMEVRILPSISPPAVLDQTCPVVDFNLKKILMLTLLRENMNCTDLAEGRIDAARIVQQRRLRGKNQ